MTVEAPERERRQAPAPSPPAGPRPWDVMVRRVIAFLIDIFIIALAMAIVMSITGNGEPPETAFGSPAVLVLTGIMLVYFFVGEALSGQTLGKRLLGLKVVTVDGGQPSWGQIFLRTLVRLLDEVLFIGFFVALLDSRRQRIGDMVASTLVVRAGKGR